MVDPGFVSGFIGYGITKTLDKALKMLKESTAFPKEYLKLYSRLVRVRPMIAALEETKLPKTPEPDGSHHHAVTEWVGQVRELLNKLEELLVEGRDFREGRFREPLKKQQFVVRLTHLTRNIDDVLQKDGVLAVVVKTERILEKQVEFANEFSDCLEKLSELIQTTAEEQASDLQVKHESYMKLLHELNEKTDDIGVMKQQVQDLMKVLHERWPSCSTSTVVIDRPVDHPLASTLKKLSDRTGRDKRCKVKLEIVEPTDDPPNRFRPPREIVPYEPAKVSPGPHRGRVIEGGFEVLNDTKVQLTFEVTSDWFFYIIQVDHAAEGSTPEIVFPKSVGWDEDYNTILRSKKEKRVFPKRQAYEDDPLSLKLVRSNIAATDSYDRLSLYVLVVNTCLTPDHEPSDSITIEDVVNALNRMLSQELHSKNVIVNRFQFDLKPSLIPVSS